MVYERLLNEAYQNNIDVYEKELSPRIKGLYADDVIWINKIINRTNEKSCVLAEELGHYHTSCGNILDQAHVENRKQEKQARQWAHNKLINLSKIIEAYKAGVNSRFELAEYLNVTETFLLEAIESLKQKYGTHTTIDNYTIFFEPLAVLEMLK